jgi:hypothetical protein
MPVGKPVAKLQGSAPKREFIRTQPEVTGRIRVCLHPGKVLCVCGPETLAGHQVTRK